MNDNINTTVQWAENKKILFVTQRYRMTPLQLVLTFDEVVDTLRAWPADRPYLGLWDISGIKNPKWNPNLAPHIEAVRNALSPYRQGRFAAVLNPKAGFRFTEIRLNIEYLFLKGIHEIAYQQFYSCEEALAWLKELL